MICIFWDRFVDLCAGINKSPTAVVLELGFSRSSVTNWKKGGVPNNVALRRIANYFNVTVNFLLCKDGTVNISNNNISGTYSIVGNSNSQIQVQDDLNSQERELIAAFRKLSEIDKAKAFIYISDLVEK